MMQYLRSIFIAFFCLMAFLSKGQDLNWVGSIGGASPDVARNIGYDCEGNIYVSGYMNGTIYVTDDDSLISQGATDIFIVKLDANGELIWAKNIGSNGPDEIEDMLIDDDGSIYITGFFSNTVDFDLSSSTSTLTSNGDDDAFFAKYTTDGDLIWVKGFGSTGSDRSFSIDKVEGKYRKYFFIAGNTAGDVSFTDNGNLFQLQGKGDWDVFYAKFDDRGRCHFLRGFGGAGRDKAKGIKVSDNFKIHITGEYEGTVDIDPRNPGTTVLNGYGEEDAFLVKYDIRGNLEWGFGIGDDRFDRGEKIALGENNEVFWVGQFRNTIDLDPSANIVASTSNGFEDAFIAKYDRNGNYIWSTTFGSKNRDRAWNITADDQFNIYVTGHYMHDVTISSGNNSVLLEGADKWDAYFSKFDNDGNLLWAFPVRGDNLDFGFDIVPNNSGDIFIAGRFTDATAFGTNNYPQFTSRGGIDAFYGKYTEATSVPVIRREGRKLISSSKFNLQWYKDGVPIIGENNHELNLTAGGLYKVEVTNASGSVFSNELRVRFRPHQSRIRIFPNPSNGNFFLRTEFAVNEVYNVSITDRFGIEVWSDELSGSLNFIQASQLTSGMYTLTITFNGTTVWKKLRIFN